MRIIDYSQRLPYCNLRHALSLGMLFLALAVEVKAHGRTRGRADLFRGEELCWKMWI